MLNRRIEDDTIIFSEGANVFFSVEEKETDQGIQLVLSGEMRSNVAHDILDEMIALTTVGANILVDFGKVTYISPTAQHVFLRVQQKMDEMGKGMLTMAGLSDEIFQEFERTGASELLMIER